MPSIRPIPRRGFALAVATTAVLSFLAVPVVAQTAREPGRAKPVVTFATVKDWNLKAENLSARGRNPLGFPLEPGFRYVLEKRGQPNGGLRVEAEVLKSTEPFDVPGIGKFECAVVQKDVLKGGKYTGQIVEWVAIDKVTQAMYAFGRVVWDVDPDGEKIIASTWRAGEPDARGRAEPGLLLPGIFKVGDRYQLDGFEGEDYSVVENVADKLTIATPAGTFKDCVRTRERNLAGKPAAVERCWCPKVGLVKDDAQGALVASTAVKGTDLSGFGKHLRAAAEPKLAGGPITEAQAKAIALERVPGKVTDVAVEQKGKHKVYTVEIVAKSDGVETDVFVDMASGKIIGVEK